MKSIKKIFELQIDEKPNGHVIRLNDEKGCVLRICQIPKELIKSGELIDVAYPKKNTNNDDTKSLLHDIISWEKDLSEYSSLETILKERYIIIKKSE